MATIKRNPAAAQQFHVDKPVTAKQKVDTTVKPGIELTEGAGVVVISGTAGIGKTSLALELTGVPPEKIAVANFDTKPIAANIVPMLGFYKSYMGTLLVQQTTEVAAIEEFLSDMENIEEGVMDTLIIDGYEKLHSFLISYILYNAGSIRTQWPGAGKWQVQSKLGYRKIFEPAIVDLLLKKFKTVIIVAHSGKSYRDDVELDGDVPLISHALTLTASAIFWMVEDDNGYPRVLVRKNKAHTTFDPVVGFTNVPTFPDVISFEAIGGYVKPYTSMGAAVRHYIRNPFGFRTEEQPYERLTEDDIRVIGGALTERDLRAIAIKQMLVAKTASENFDAIKKLFNEGERMALKIKLKLSKLGIEADPEEITGVLAVLNNLADAETAYANSFKKSGVEQSEFPEEDGT